MRTIASPSSVKQHRTRCYVCKNVLNPTKPSTIAFMRSDEWPYRDWVIAHIECGESAGLRTVRLSSTEPIPATLEETEVPSYTPFSPWNLFGGDLASRGLTLSYDTQPLLRTLEAAPDLDFPNVIFEITCVRPGEDPQSIERHTYEDAIALYRQTEYCGGVHDLTVRRA